MQDHLEDLSKGLETVFSFKEGYVFDRFTKWTFHSCLIVSLLVGGYLNRDKDPLQGAGAGALVYLSGSFAAFFLWEGYFGLKYKERLRERYGALLEQYPLHLDTFVQRGPLPENIDSLIEDALRIDALPYHVQNFDVLALERTLSGISNPIRYDLPFLPSIPCRLDSNLISAYQYLADLLADTTLTPADFISLFNDREKISPGDNYPLWVGGNRLTWLYHEKKRYDDEETFRALSRFKYNYHGPTSNS